MSRKVKFISSFIVLLSFIVFRIVNYDINLSNISKHESRPVVFGEELCSEIYSHKFTLSGDLLERVNYFLSSKTAIRAKFGSKNVFIKTPACDDEFQVIEDEFSSKFNDKLLHSENSIDIIKLHIQSLIRIPQGTDLQPKLRLCPQCSNTENLFNKINSSDFQVQDYLHIWTTVQSNPEPLILKILKPPQWPVPVYYGSCGRLIVVEDCGTMLTNFYTSPWSVRAQIAVQLIEGAIQLTSGDMDFGYYLTDMSPDNIAISENGVVKFIDLEHVIVVDQQPLSPETIGPDWRQTHTSKHFDCFDCTIFEADSICEHKTSDHNIYAVCKEIFGYSPLLPDGLLHSPPPEIPELSTLNDLISACIEGHTYSRFQTAAKLMELLKSHL